MSENLQAILEALLFAADHPLSPQEVSQWLPEYSAQDIRGALQAIESEYRTMGRSFFLKEVAKGYQFRTKKEFGPYILKMYKTSPSRLSGAALETLAIIAYKQPILRQEIEKLRGVDVGGILRTLLEKGLVRIVGRKDLPGRPLIYGTTKKFLEVFDLTDLTSLPKLKEIKNLFSGGESGQPALASPEGTTDAGHQESQETKPSGQPPED
ncbi:MAG: SMC-Scp complex subunit ScpB [Deltaproteobacteria bacterium]|nr:MAG: SMC-Scp complex subunit ScpB [Desulfobacteraceae bacterium 4484_190.3]RLB15499.1 MAG: SMC-Scp complex subunit ScpB [Deltaproteobacteria bacterium]